MAIVQISKIQQRAGNLVDLPQLDNGEFGWATDENRLFIGRTGNTYSDENIEVLTSYSNISFSQINGSDGGNFNITVPLNGQILTYVSSTDTWENYTGLTTQLDGAKLKLGNVSNISMTGGAIGYILETDGLGNLSWTPKNTLYSNITNFYPTVFTGSIGTSTLSGVVIVGTGGQFTCTASSTTLYVGMAVTISGTNGGGGSITGYTNPTTYLISVTDGSTSFTLTTSLGDAIVTTSGTPTGLTYTLSNLLNISAATSGSVGVGTYITGTSVTAGTYITAYGTGTEGTGTYIVNTSQTIASTTLYGPLIMRVANTTPYTNGQAVTISGANGVANSSINGLTFYITLTANYASSGNVSLYTDSGRTAIANVSTLTYTNSPNAIATAALGGSGSGVVGGSNTTVQFNDQNISNGVAAFTFDKNTTTLTISSGNVIAANINATTAVTSPILVSNIAVGTAPLTVTSTTLVPNLFVARSNVSEYANTALTNTGTWYPLFVNATSGNLAQGANANLSFNAATGNLTTTLLNVTSNANTGNLGTTTLVATTGNITTINSGLMQNSTSNITIASAGNVSTFIGGNATAQFVVTSTGANIPGTANVVTLVTSTATITTGNITTINSGLMQNGSANITIASNGNVSIYANANTTAALVIANSGINVPGYANIGGNANIGNLGTAQVLASANITTPQFISNVASGTAPLSVQSTTVVPNLYVARSNVSEHGNVVSQTIGTFYPTMVSASTSANYQLGSNANLSFAVSTGTLSATLFTGTLTTAAQPNITSVGNLTTLTVSGRSNLNAVGNVYISGGTANQILKTDGSGNLSWTDPNGGYYLHTQVSTASTWTVTHNLNRQYLTVEPIDSSGNSYTGRYDYPTINYTNANSFTMTFLSAVAGYAAVTGGGTNINAVSTGNSTPGGVNTQVQFNDAGNMAGSSGLVYNKTTGTLSATLFAGSGANLTNIDGANVTGTVASATNAAALLQNTSTATTVYPTFTASSANGNSSAVINTSISANLGNASITATTFVGALSGAATSATSATNAAALLTTLTTTGTVYVPFISATATGNYAHLSNANFSANLANGYITATGFVGTLSGAATTAGTVTTNAQPNITSVGTLTSLGVNGTVTAVAFTANTGVFTGNGNGLSSIVGANVSGTVANATYATSAGSATTAGTITTNAQPNITSTGTLTSLAVTGNITNGNVTGGNLVSANYFTGTLTTAAQPNITSVSTSFTNLTFANAQTISGNNMTLTTGANTLSGTITGNWSLSAGSKLQATYADLAEYYEADKPYEPGTVLEFGGEKEVTLAQAMTPRVAGVVSTNPAYVMNSTCEGEHIVAIALQGRVPCKVRGTIRKGDLLISDVGGFAKPSSIPLMGTVIGKALENFEGEGVIEVAVGRL